MNATFTQKINQSKVVGYVIKQPKPNETHNKSLILQELQSFNTISSY